MAGNDRKSKSDQREQEYFPAHIIGSPEVGWAPDSVTRPYLQGPRFFAFSVLPAPILRLIPLVAFDAHLR